MNSRWVEHSALSPDRSHLAWSGPEGSFLADLATGKVERRPNGYRWDELPVQEPEKRTFRWLPDASGFLEHHWIDGKPHWELFEPDSEGPTASGEGRVDEISPDCSYWAIVNEQAVAGDYSDPDETPRLIRPVPGHRPTPDTRTVSRQWLIGREGVTLFTVQRTGPDQWVWYRITPDVHVALPLPPAELPPPVTMLSPDDGGRLTLSRSADGVLVGDFAGQERFRIAGAWPLWTFLPGKSVVAVVDRKDGIWRVRLVDVLFGKETEVLTCEAPAFEGLRGAGQNHYIALTGTRAVRGFGDLFGGGIDGRSWQRIANDLCGCIVTPQVAGERYWRDGVAPRL